MRQKQIRVLKVTLVGKHIYPKRYVNNKCSWIVEMRCISRPSAFVRQLPLTAILIVVGETVDSDLGLAFCTHIYISNATSQQYE